MTKDEAEYREIAVTAIRRFILQKDMGPSSKIREGLENIIDEIRTPQTKAGDKPSFMGMEVRVDKSMPPDTIRLEKPSPGPLSAADERGFLWLENQCQDCPECLTFIGTLRARLSEHPAAPQAEVTEGERATTEARYRALEVLRDEDLKNWIGLGKEDYAAFQALLLRFRILAKATPVRVSPERFSILCDKANTMLGSGVIIDDVLEDILRELNIIIEPEKEK